MTQRRAAAPYAKALFALAKERNQTELVGRELGDGGGRDRAAIEPLEAYQRLPGPCGSPTLGAVVVRQSRL